MTLPVQTLVVPADYCVAFIDAATYSGFVSEQWGLDEIRRHFVEQMRNETMVAWGTDAPGNWRIEVGGEREIPNGYREFIWHIRATSGSLHLTAYDELTVAAQCRDVRLPVPGTPDSDVRLQAGHYKCRVVQLYDPQEAESEAVFYQESPHFAVEFTPTHTTAQLTLDEVPWFG